MDHSAILPNGKSFEFWEVPVTYKKEIHVNQNHPTERLECANTAIPTKYTIILLMDKCFIT